MSFKHHLLIVSCLIGLLFVAWQYMITHQAASPFAAAPPPAEPSDGKSIEITRASWGLNCINKISAANASRADYITGDFIDPDAEPPKENNVLQPVAKLCNKKRVCQISPVVELLGKDPAPTCKNKRLDIEYRCFSFDRPWRASNTKGDIVIDCNKQKGP